MAPITPCIFAYIGKVSVCVLFVSMVLIVLLCCRVQEEKDPYPGEEDSLAVPVYFSPNREDFICEIKMPCRGGKTDWVLSGVALFLTDLK